MGRKILVTSGKGGVGKTTVVAGLARALACKNATVCVVDGDMGLNNLDILMAIENKVVYDISDCISGKCHIKQAIVKDALLDNLFTMPSGKIQNCEPVVPFEEIINKLAAVFDFVIVDCPAGIGNGFVTSSKSCREAIIVVTPHISSVRDASKILNTLYGDKTKSNINVVVNRLRGDLVASGEMMSHKDIEKVLNSNVIGELPENDEYNITSSFSFAANSKNELVQALMILAENIVADKNLEFDYTAKYKGLLGLIRRKIKKL